MHSLVEGNNASACRAGVSATLFATKYTSNGSLYHNCHLHYGRPWSAPCFVPLHQLPISYLIGVVVISVVGHFT